MIEFVYHLIKKMKNKDNVILKTLNNELKNKNIKLKMQYYHESPFKEYDKDVIPIIISYVEQMENKENKVFILSTLGVLGFDDAVEYLINQYKKILLIYTEPYDEILLLHLCDTIARIRSRKYIDLYIEILELQSTTALEIIIKMLEKLKIEGIEKYIFNLIEKENIIPKAWFGQLNEEDKYWCSQKALEYIVRKKDKKYYAFLKKFLFPETLQWINFKRSKYEKVLYSNCYKKYKQIAQKGLKLL